MSSVYFDQDQYQKLNTYLTSDASSEGCLDYIASHGFLTAMAIISDDIDVLGAIEIILDEEPVFQSASEQSDIELAISALHKQISRQLYLGEEFELPARLEPSKPGQTNELTDWCFGFMEGVGVVEDDWFNAEHDPDAVADLLMPFIIFSEPHVDPELKHLVESNRQRNNMAGEIPDNLQQLYLLFRD